MNRFFIIGNPRSGTTLFRLMLNKHPELVVPPESAFITWLESNNDKFINNGHFVEELSKCKKIEHWNLDYKKLLNYLNSLDIKSNVDYYDHVYMFYAQELIEKKCYSYGDKNNSYLYQIDQLTKLFPESKFIHIIRDGRSVSASYKELSQSNYTNKYAPNLPSDMKEIAKHWVENIEIIERSFKNIDSRRQLTLRFEDLISSPRVELEKVCEFIGVSYNSEMLNYHKTSEKEGIEPINEYQWKKKNLSDIDINQIEKYKILSNSEINDFESIAEKKLLAYRYLK